MISEAFWNVLLCSRQKSLKSMYFFPRKVHFKLVWISIMSKNSTQSNVVCVNYLTPLIKCTYHSQELIEQWARRSGYDLKIACMVHSDLNRRRICLIYLRITDLHRNICVFNKKQFSAIYMCLDFRIVWT